MIANWVEGVFSPGAERSGKREDRDTTALSIAKLIQMMAVAVPETPSPPAKACRTSQLTDKKMAAPVCGFFRETPYGRAFFAHPRLRGI